MKRKRLDKVSPSSCDLHELPAEKVEQFRDSLLRWYDINARQLPWRDRAKTETDDNVRGYSVLVSEIMLQQTQVATVIDYYHKWMKKWPTTAALAAATLEEVNQVWAGLGYYSRGRRLWESAQIIEKDLNGVMPKSAVGLRKLPGVGRYTAAVVASIAYGQSVGLVDGNVQRVFARLCSMGLEINCQSAEDWVWKLSENAVDSQRPGDFNQALMELGATVCTPKSPSCAKCPVRGLCQGYAMSTGEIRDIEDSCHLCLQDKFEPELGVMNFPRKSKKSSSKDVTTLVLALRRLGDNGETRYAVQQRPKDGLLANLWELISVEVTEKGGDHLDSIVSYLEQKKVLYKDLKKKGGKPL